ncbi:MAG: hypothetical protein NZ839_01895, partial [Endomicrobia bacterium]|nr:hypothetical protein [Endomicrobiia bacterium]
IGITSLSAKPYNSIFVDGELSDWDLKEEIRINEPGDSLWNIGEVKNDIRNLYVTWDKYNLYIGFNLELSNAGVVVYFSYEDTTGSKDLTRVNIWRRLVQFSYPVNLFYAAWENQQGGFYKVENSTYVYDVSWWFEKKYKDGFYEIKLPFNKLFPYSETTVKKYAKVYMVVCIVTGDVGTDQYGSYGCIAADTLPDNEIVFISTTTITNFYSIELDSNGDGTPDDFNFTSGKFLAKVVPKTVPVFQINPILEYTPSDSGKLVVNLIDINTEQNIGTLHSGYVIAGQNYKIQLNLRDYAYNISSGVYILNLRLETTKKVEIKNLPVVLIK